MLIFIVFSLLLFQEGSQIFVFSCLGLRVARERAGVTWQPFLKALGIRYSKSSLFEDWAWPVQRVMERKMTFKDWEDGSELVGPSKGNVSVP